VYFSWRMAACHSPHYHTPSHTTPGAPPPRAPAPHVGSACSVAVAGTADAPERDTCDGEGRRHPRRGDDGAAPTPTGAVCRRAPRRLRARRRLSPPPSTAVAWAVPTAPTVGVQSVAARARRLATQTAGSAAAAGTPPGRRWRRPPTMWHGRVLGVAPSAAATGGRSFCHGGGHRGCPLQTAGVRPPLASALPAGSPLQRAEAVAGGPVARPGEVPCGISHSTFVFSPQLPFPQRCLPHNIIAPVPFLPPSCYRL